MPEIKTRELVGETIKSIDHTTLAGQRMRNAYIKIKETAEQNLCSSESNSEEYASDSLTNGLDTASRETVQQVGNNGERLFHSIHGKNNQNSQPYSTAQEAFYCENNNPVQPRSGVVPEERKQFCRDKDASTPSPIRSIRRIKTIRTKESNPEIVRTASSSNGNSSYVFSGRAVKTSSRFIRSSDQSGTSAVKTVQSANRAGEHMIHTAVKNTSIWTQLNSAAYVKKTTEQTAKAAKAIARATKELISALIAGGSTVLVLVMLLVVLGFAGMMLASDDNDIEVLPISDEVIAYEPIIQKYAKQYGIGEYVLLIEAVMMQESGGRTTDPMQCSECNFNTRYPHTPGSITDPEYSIEVGIQNLANCLQIAECESPVDMDHIKLALQGYNYGQGYITWAINQYGEYSKANAIEFSIKTAEQVGWSSYGDKEYVSHVLRYYPLGQIFYDPDTSTLIVEVAASQIGNIGGEPYWSWYGFTERVEWCACFVGWCANQCGYIDADIIPKFSGCIVGMNWFKERGQWASNQIEPLPGMIVFFDWEDESDGGGLDGLPDHVGIVGKVENGRVYTIEGNTSDSCRERSYPIGDYRILGYGEPAY